VVDADARIFVREGVKVGRLEEDGAKVCDTVKDWPLDREGNKAVGDTDAEADTVLDDVDDAVFVAIAPAVVVGLVTVAKEEREADGEAETEFVLVELATVTVGVADPEYVTDGEGTSEIEETNDGVFVLWPEEVKTLDDVVETVEVTETEGVTVLDSVTFMGVDETFADVEKIALVDLSPLTDETGEVDGLEEREGRSEVVATAVLEPPPACPGSVRFSCMAVGDTDAVDDLEETTVAEIDDTAVCVPVFLKIEGEVEALELVDLVLVVDKVPLGFAEKVASKVVRGEFDDWNEAESVLEKRVLAETDAVVEMDAVTEGDAVVVGVLVVLTDPEAVADVDAL